MFIGASWFYSGSFFLNSSSAFQNESDYLIHLLLKYFAVGRYQIIAVTES